MTRFEKKCFVGAAALHGLLLVGVVASAAFQGPPPQQPVSTINWVALQTTDKPGLMKGNPDAKPVVKTEAPAAKPAEPQPQKAQPEPEKTEPRPEPTKAQTHASKPPKHHVEPDLTPTKSSDSEPINTKSWKPRSTHDIKVDLGSKSVVKKPHTTKSSTSSDDSDARAEESARKATARSISRALGGLATSITKGAAKAEVFDLPGQGGGAAFVDYRTALFSAYYNAWICPQDIDNDLASVEVKVVVARNGSVVSAEITKKSSDSSLNRSVQRALDSVSKLPPFPEGANDDQRSFKLRFNLKAKQSLG
jgi:TonB family protein